MAFHIHRRPILPHQLGVDRSEVLVHPGRQIPLTLLLEERLDLGRLPLKTLPPVCDCVGHLSFVLGFVVLPPPALRAAEWFSAVEKLNQAQVHGCGRAWTILLRVSISITRSLFPATSNARLFVATGSRL